MERIVTSRPVGGWVSSLCLQPGQPVQYVQRIAVSMAVAAPPRPPEHAGPVAIGSLLPEVLARYGLAAAEQEPLAPVIPEPVDLVA